MAIGFPEGPAHQASMGYRNQNLFISQCPIPPPKIAAIAMDATVPNIIRIMNAGIAAMASLTISTTIDQNGIFTSVTTISRFASGMRCPSGFGKQIPV
jgi:hypothetical protein